MRTNIDIDDELLTEAMKIHEGKTKKAVVEEGLRMLLKLNAQTGIRKLRGKVEFYDDVVEDVRLHSTGR